MNGVDVSGVGSAVSSQTDVWWFILPFVAAMAVIALLKIAMMLSPEKAEMPIRALVSEHYQVEYPSSTPERGGSVMVTLEGKSAESHNSIDLLKAKGRAAEQYMKNTGLPFVLLRESSDAKGLFKRYDSQETFGMFLKNRASQSELKSFNKFERQEGIPHDLNWMTTLGLSDDEIEVSKNSDSADLR